MAEHRHGNASILADLSKHHQLFLEKFPLPGDKAKLYPMDWVQPCEGSDSKYDLHLNSRRLLEHFEQGSRTYRSEGIAEMTPTNFLEVSPELAKKRGIASGRWLHVTLRNGNVRLRALVTDRVSGKQLYMPMNSVEEPVNRLTNNHIDRAMHTPAFEGGSGDEYSPSGAGRESTRDDKSPTGARQMAPSLNFKPNPLQLNSAFNSRIP